MFLNYKKWLLLLCSILILSGCGAQLNGIGDGAENQTHDIQSIADLHDTSHFRKGALEHIFEGEINRRGDAVGFHYDGLPTKKGDVIDGTETDPNQYGVYEAKIEVDGVKKKSNGGKSTLFPDEWDAQQVVDAINDAYEARTFISGNTYEGLTKDGMPIRMYLDQNKKIISAFPVY
ncbi:EndoU domain-containing protein [Virgibacillus sp. 179-BFC.A HS]|uniref:EndoU domain-containing protein n=1 Tax=Tigheibacillus jepli TaxID=3035914 RepID=A0ABU5CIG2_9BACI|nr:EndoU domain-containing protein [Virgibacillus sp. 179-BFC.A HS]MDY0406110.1 EndoU domain-containing protein [Virgibacillus sp. 179-BFC.A HS]